MSLALLGAEPLRGVLIKVRNAQELAAAQGGTAGAIAASVAPGMIEGVVLNKIAEQLGPKFREQGVVADVSVVPVASVGGPNKRTFEVGIAVGAASMGLLWGLSRIF